MYSEQTVAVAVPADDEAGQVGDDLDSIPAFVDVCVLETARPTERGAKSLIGSSKAGPTTPSETGSKIISVLIHLFSCALLVFATDFDSSTTNWVTEKEEPERNAATGPCLPSQCWREQLE